MTRSIAVFGGTFDPVHNAHLAVAEEARRNLAVSDFRLIPAADPPHRDRTHASARHRLAMLRLALGDHPHLKVDTREMDRAGPSYMVDTLAGLRTEFPDTPLLLLIGQDSANSFDAWHRWREIPQLAHLVILSRPGKVAAYGVELRSELQARLAADAGQLLLCPAGLAYSLKVSAHDLSSTEVRSLLVEGGAMEAHLPPAVAEYIRDHELYAGSPGLPGRAL